VFVFVCAYFDKRYRISWNLGCEVEKGVLQKKKNVGHH
jgi:hypothetical protein